MRIQTCLLFFLLLPFFGYTQEYVAEAPLSKVTTSGFYSITLTPNITAKLKGDLLNIRLYDSQNADVPYIMLTDQKDVSTFQWVPMAIRKEIRKNCCTIITIGNDKKEYVDNFLLKFKNANITKIAALRGSDDGEVWYAVYERAQLLGNKSSNEERSQLIEIPISNYKYYQLTINDSTSSPINMLTIERTREDIMHGGYVEIPEVRITSYDSLQGRETWGVIEFDTAQYVDRIEFDVAGPHLFKRNATLLKKVKNHFETITTFDIISGQGRPLHVFAREKTLYIRVNNDNNPPLKFTQVAAYQLKRSLIAYFESGRDYRIVVGDTLRTPTYDLEYFKDSIPMFPSELEIGTLKERSVLKEAEAQPTIFTDRKYIWAAIILVGIVLAAMTIRMIKDKDFRDRQSH